MAHAQDPARAPIRVRMGGAEEALYFQFLSPTPPGSTAHNTAGRGYKTQRRVPFCQGEDGLLLGANGCPPQQHTRGR